MTTATAISSDSLPLAAVLADLREQHAAASGRDARYLAGDLQWAQIDQARALHADEHARALAEELARAGDEDAAAALTLAHELEPLPALGAVRGNFGCCLPIGGGAVPHGLVELLAEHRRDGLSFNVSWELARAEVYPGDAGPWADVLRCTKEAWRAAFERRPAPRGYDVLAWDDDE